jgi:hypothetical protein
MSLIPILQEYEIVKKEGRSKKYIIEFEGKEYKFLPEEFDEILISDKKLDNFIKKEAINILAPDWMKRFNAEYQELNKKRKKKDVERLERLEYSLGLKA